jgi:homoserine kinase
MNVGSVGEKGDAGEMVGAGEEVTAFAPATVGNLSCGFDVFGLALEAPGDRVTARRSDTPGVTIRRITGDGGRLPIEADRNGAGVAAQTLLAVAGITDGVELDLEKGTPLSGGMGGSAASAVAAAVAVDGLFRLDSSPSRLFDASLAGEGVAASGHADNVAPALFGGIVLVRHSPVRPYVQLPVPEGLSVALLHPAIELDTRAGRERLGTSVPLRDAVYQWGNTAALVAALHSSDWELLGDALVDKVAEPVRAPQIPAFHQVGSAARGAGAVGWGISGSGPSIFALCRSLRQAREVGAAMKKAFHDTVDLEATLHVSPVAREGARVLGPPWDDDGGRGGGRSGGKDGEGEGVRGPIGDDE